MNNFDILRKPIVTEKSTDLQEQGRYIFEVAPRATKHQVKEAIENAFDVKVLRVNTCNIRGKRKRVGMSTSVRPSRKKAVVTLAPGQSITIFEGV